MPRLSLPPEFACAAGDLAHDRRFMRMLRLGRAWHPPRLVLWLAARFGYAWGGDPAVTMCTICAGFGGADRPWRVALALGYLCWACRPWRWRGYVYANRNLLVLEVGERRRWGPTDSILRPSSYGSLGGLPPVAGAGAEAPSPKQPASAQPSPRQAILYR